VAESGTARGENIYVHKCWVCHNQYQGSAPRLTEFFQGGGMDEQGLTIQIRDA
jgi:cytochrome c5